MVDSSCYVTVFGSSFVCTKRTAVPKACMRKERPPTFSACAWPRFAAAVVVSGRSLVVDGDPPHVNQHTRNGIRVSFVPGASNYHIRKKPSLFPSDAVANTTHHLQRKHTIQGCPNTHV